MDRWLFTASQLEELRHQVLIFNYMASGIQVPCHLLYNLTGSSNSTTRQFPLNQGFAAGLGLGSGSYHMGSSKKEVSEPERCKRSDGKKWRCTRETHQDSKYCERHMHRGRNSSRKHVEISATTTTTTTTTITKPVTEIHSDSIPDCSFLQSSTLLHPASLYPRSSCRPRSSSTRQFLSESGSSYSQKNNYRFLHATRDRDTAFSKKVPETVRCQKESYLPLEIASSDSFCHPKDHGKSENQHRQEKKDPQQHCFIIGDDFKPAKTIKLDRGEDNPKRFHHFFSECPLKSKDPQFDNDQPNHGSVSNTQFSASTPFSMQELFQPKPSPFKY